MCACRTNATLSLAPSERCALIDSTYRQSVGGFIQRYAHMAANVDELHVAQCRERLSGALHQLDVGLGLPSLGKNADGIAAVGMNQHPRGGCFLPAGDGGGYGVSGAQD